MLLTAALLLGIVIPFVTAGQRLISKSIDAPLQLGDEVIIRGRGYGRSIGIIRLMDSQSQCGSRANSVQPLVLKLKARARTIELFNKYQETNCRDTLVERRSGVTGLAVNTAFVITIKATENGYQVSIGNNGNQPVFTTTGGLGSVQTIRAFSGNYDNIVVNRYVPVVRHCGKRLEDLKTARSTLRARITSGYNAKAGEYPWQAAIRKVHVFDWNPVAHLCGATLIQECWALTAAHCTKQIKDYESDYLVRLGDLYNRDDNTNHRADEHQQDLQIEKVILHENYSQSGAAPINDISLIKLKKVNGSCSKLSNFVNPACLPTPGMDSFPANTTCEISGWGAQNWEQAPTKYPARLQKGKIKLQDFNRCRDVFGQENGVNLIRNGMICAGGKSDTCQGDSGGPLVCQHDSNSPFIIWGITSWGEKCAASNKPGVYTDVLKYIEWIKEKIATYRE